ncbi:hypothetical protein NQ318_015702 [Aromia moschata]|uniref:C-type lectin domain-containing protein n=1 Tax=Aromia moschata TaxID=1265417 RepID=A0AAV8YGI7_9CUCU|nr:hypothetical protein NQ318_015702 [Aromia moschata]
MNRQQSFLYLQGNFHTAGAVCRSNGYTSVKIDNQHKSDLVTSLHYQAVSYQRTFWSLASRLFDGITWAFDSVEDPVNTSTGHRVNLTMPVAMKNALKSLKTDNGTIGNASSRGYVFVRKKVLRIKILVPEQYGDSPYRVFGKANYFMALEVCAANGLRLIRINDQNKNDEVTYFIEKLTAITGPYWTSASRLYDGHTWAFAVGDPVKYFNWAAGEPNNAGGNEQCVEILRRGEWNDKDCATERFVLCESRQ